MCFSLQWRAIFWHPNFKKVSETMSFFNTLTLKCASRHGVPFFHILTPKSGANLVCFVHFDLKICFSLQRRAIFHFSSKQLYTSAPAALPSLLFAPADPQIIENTQQFAAFLTFRSCGSSFYWLSTAFHLLTASLLCFFNCPYCRKLDF